MKLLRLGAMGAAAGAVLMILVFFIAFAWYSRELPKPGEVVRKQGFSTKLYDRNGQLLYDLYDQERRTPVEIEQMPDSLKQATVAIEDKDFYKHGGFDLMTLVRIPYNIVFKQRVIGGSTLTQQLVKNALLTNERSIARKFKELVLSLQIERNYSKDEILEMYLNEAPYGGTAWGVGTAAEVYFNKPVSELTMIESAILAGLPQRPSAYSPYGGKTDTDGTPLWQVRTKGVLRRMHEDGYLTDLAYQDGLSQLETIKFERAPEEINAPHFVFYVRDKLAEMYGEELVETSGFKVTTTLDLELHKEAQTIVREEVEKVRESLNITNGAALVTDPRTGEIISMIGSSDYTNSDIGGQFNVVVDGLRQPGSAIKPVTYLALLQRGYTPASVLVDVPTTFQATENDKPYTPQNYDGNFRGPVSVRNSLGSSLNIPAVKALGIVGVENFLSLANEMGLYTLEPTEANKKRFGLAVTLGGAEVHMLDLATAYAAFANQGKKVEPVSILKVEDKDGKIIFEHRQVEGSQVMTTGEAYLINHILSDNNARSIAFGTNSLLNTGKPIAVKTGTTNELKDNWAIGWSQEVLVSAWVGNNDSTAMKAVASGVSGATPIWRRVILAALAKGYGAPDWKMPSDVEQVMVDSISGYPEHDEHPARSEVVIKGTLPSLPDQVHAKLKVCRGDSDKLATDPQVVSGNYDERDFIVLKENDPVSQDGVNRWQIGIDSWISSQQDERYKFPTEYCGDREGVSVILTAPKKETTFENEDIKVKFEAGASDGIDKIELWVNGKKHETINDNKYEGTINLPAGRYEIYAKAFSKSGKEAKSSTHRIGTGGKDWKALDSFACNSECDNDSQCQSVDPGFICQDNRCRLESNSSDSSCQAPPTPTLSPLPTITP
jgi:penicillin-binding protein 1C